MFIIEIKWGLILAWSFKANYLSMVAKLELIHVYGHCNVYIFYQIFILKLR